MLFCTTINACLHSLHWNRQTIYTLKKNLSVLCKHLQMLPQPFWYWLTTYIWYNIASVDFFICRCGKWVWMENGAQCYGDLDVQLINSTLEKSQYSLLKSYFKLLNVKDNKVISNGIAHRYLFCPSNGTFSINNLSRNDSGKNILPTFDSDGRIPGVWGFSR